MAKKTNLNYLSAISIALGFIAISCGTLLYLESPNKTLQSEFLIAVSLVSVTGLVIIHLTMLTRQENQSFSSKQIVNSEDQSRTTGDHKFTTNDNEVPPDAGEETKLTQSTDRKPQGGGRIEDIQEKELSDATLRKFTETRDKLREMAYFDSLTSLPNRRLFTEQLDLLMKQSRRTGQMLALMFIDLDNFKQINDSLGHSAGDKLLQEVAIRLRNSVRESDVVTRSTASDLRADVSRFGGDEFTLILTDLESREAANQVASRVIRDIVEPVGIEGKQISITTSIGIALAPDHAVDVTTLLKAADTAMYHAKKRGKDSYLLYDREMDAANIEKLRLERDLREAVVHQELKLVYQPQIDIHTGTVTGAEALLRWEHPRLGLVSPSKFVPLAEELGLISEIGEWSLTLIGRQLKKIADQSKQPFKISINVSQSQFNERLVNYLEDMVKNHLIPIDRLTLELTESILLENNDSNLSLVHSLKSMGVSLSIDDFGTGFSSLSYLIRLPLDQLKIDRSFVLNLFNQSNSENIISAIIAMTASLDLELICEGVENARQCEFLGSKGARIIQGYLFSEPIAEDKLIQMLKPATYLTQVDQLRLNSAKS